MRPTRREATTVKKKPSTTMSTRPPALMSTPGHSHSTSTAARMTTGSSHRGRSCSVRREERAAAPLLRKVAAKVRTIMGMDLMTLMMPPAASAPAPI